MKKPKVNLSAYKETWEYLANEINDVINSNVVLDTELKSLLTLIYFLADSGNRAISEYLDKYLTTKCLLEPEMMITEGKDIRTTIAGLSSIIKKVIKYLEMTNE